MVKRFASHVMLYYLFYICILHHVRSQCTITIEQFYYEALHIRQDRHVRDEAQS